MYGSLLLLNLAETSIDPTSDSTECDLAPALIATPATFCHFPDSSEIRDFVLRGGLAKHTQSYVFISLFAALEHITQTRLHLANRTGLEHCNAQFITYLNMCYFHIIRLYRRIAKRFTMYTFMYLFLIALLRKDLSLVRNFFEEKFKNLRFKKHRRVLSMLRYVFRILLALFLHHNLIKGFRMELAGKIGAAGSVKKKTWTYRHGQINLSTKGDLLKYEVGSLWTQSGCLGLRLYLAY